jgi:hypothetical protein
MESFFQYATLIAVVFTLILVVLLFLEFKKLRFDIDRRLGSNNEMIKLKLQALERLTLYCDRASLKNMIARVDYSQGSAAVLHQTLIASLKTEYDYNASQQIYVSPEIWSAVNRLRDQNIFILNQIASTLPDGASALQLSKLILEFSMNQEAELSNIVLNAINFEAKKILN